MTKRRTILFAALLLPVAACGTAPQPAAAPATATAAGPTVPLEPPPVYALLGARAELGLTSEQISALDSIGTANATRNNPLVWRLRELRGDFRGRAESPLDEAVPPFEEARVLADRIRENNRAAAAGVREVLTPEQETRTCEVFRESEERRREARRMAGQQQQSRATGPRARRGPVIVEVAPIWPWCGPQGAPAGDAAPAAPADTTAPAAPADTTGVPQQG